MSDALAVEEAIAVVRNASRSLARLLDSDPEAPAVLDDLGHRAPVDTASVDGLVRWKRHEFLRIAARDLLGIDALEPVAAGLAAMAADVLDAAVRLADGDGLAVIGMGKLGGRELNYASDVDVMLVGEREHDPDALERSARAAVDIARRCFRVDLNLRPEGRDGALVRTLPSYEAYWDRWADPWEFQALLKARSVGGDKALGAAFDASAAAHLWARPFTAESIRSVRAMKARAEADVARRGLSDRELKLGTGGIRDVEFAVQLLQLVHGGADEELRTPTTLTALAELTDAGYVARLDADQLAAAYCYLRTVEHRLQLDDEQQIHAIPESDLEQDRLARVLGYTGTVEASAAEHFLRDLRAHQSTVRAIHERLWFRPLLEAFAHDGERILTEEAAAARLAAFGFSDVERTRQAVRELTRGLTRSSRLMQQLLPLLLDWLSAAPDPDLGLLGLRNLASGPQRSMELATAFRESPEVAWRLCRLLGTSRVLGETLRRNPDMIDSLADPAELRLRSRDELVEGTRAAVGWRPNPEGRWSALKRFTDREGLRIAAHDVLDLIDVSEVGGALTNVAEATLEAAVSVLEPPLPFAVIALGRLGGGELSYASDLDILFVYDGSTPSDFAVAERVATSLLRDVGGNRPHIYDLDADLRPEGKDGPLARSLEGFRTYFEGYAQPWERLAMVRARAVAGDPDLASRFFEVLEPFVWRDGLSDSDRREIRRIKARVEHERIPANEDAKFHLKLGRGSLSDIEFAAQLLQLDHGVRSPGTIEALDALLASQVLDAEDHDVLATAYRFCERTRNRWFLVNSAPGDTLPPRLEELERLATSLGTNAHQLRDDYRRVTRRSRRVFERLFYGLDQ
ncbi:MAG: [glutamine synthetase] adenylyltransferase / [glutamine synthetase]-adenylyl-L-tyrosine [Acidimicrobiaceae bacterium]|jgi:glutamate-ammonia-ligase adenylyltransferase